MYTKDLNKEYRKIPKEHKKTVQKIVKIAFQQGVEKTQELMQEICNIPKDSILGHYVVHEDEIDGG